MKIALIGAQGVGKSTLSKLLYEELPGSVFVKETIRECPYGLDEDTDFKTQWWALSHGILAEQEALEKKAKAIISDRCIIDAVVYAQIVHRLNSSKISAEQFELVVQSAKNWIKLQPYDHVFFIKVNSSIWETRDIDDGFRSTSLEWYRSLESEFNSTIKLLDVQKASNFKVINNDDSIEEALSSILIELSHNNDFRQLWPSSRSVLLK